MKATHFIEVYSNSLYTTNTGIMGIDFLSEYLSETKNSTWLKTIAVWKIKFKENANK